MDVTTTMTPAVDPWVPVLYRVHAVRRETADTFTMDLVAAAGPVPVAFAPGQFNMLYVPGVGEVPISISGDPACPERLVHTTRAVGAVTRAMQRMRRGDVIGVRGPLGTPWPVDEAEGSDIVLIAGGIGLPPLRAALYRVLAHRERFGRIVVLYGSRTAEDLVFRKEVEQWRARLDLEVRVTVDRAAAGWYGDVGVVTTLLPKATFDPISTVAMICGPEVMMRFAARDLEKRGVPADAIYVSMERNMQCGAGLCGRCQFGPVFVCRDGPVFRYDRVRQLLQTREI